MSKLYERIAEACDKDGKDNGLVSVVNIKPIGGFDNNRLMPPSYATNGGDPYHVETRQINNETKEIVVLDSIQSSANGREMAILRSINDGDIKLPIMSLDLGLPYNVQTQYELPHRVTDGIFAHATLNGVNFQKTEYGKALFGNNYNETGKMIFRLHPLSLALGCWASAAGFSAEKAFTQKRIMESEVIAPVASRTKRTGGRLSPVAISKSLPIYAKATEGFVEIAEKATPGYTKSEFSVVGLNDIPPSFSFNGKGSEFHKGGVSVFSPITETCIFTFAGLRLLKYWKDKNQTKSAWAYVTSLGILSHILRTDNYSLRSGCELEKIDDAVVFRWSSDNNEKTNTFSLTKQEGFALVEEALAAVKEAKVEYDETLNVTLTCSETYKKSVEKHQWKTIKEQEEK